jgi:hypothetical protein
MILIGKPHHFVSMNSHKRQRINVDIPINYKSKSHELPAAFKNKRTNKQMMKTGSAKIKRRKMLGLRNKRYDAKAIARTVNPIIRSMIFPLHFLTFLNPGLKNLFFLYSRN